MGSDYEWIISSDRDQNQIIVMLMEEGSFDEKTAVLDELAKRKDRDFSEIADYIYYSAGIRENEREFLLYLVMDKLFENRNDFSHSRDSFMKIMNDVSIYKGSFLRKKIMEKTRVTDESCAVKVLLREAEFLNQKTLENRMLDNELLEEYRVFADTVSGFDSAVLADYVNLIYENALNIPDSFRKPLQNR